MGLKGCKSTSVDFIDLFGCSLLFCLGVNILLFVVESKYVIIKNKCIDDIIFGEILD
jgi:hypothetical protein